VSLPAPGTIQAPDPAAIAAAVERSRQRAALAVVVVDRPTPAAVPHKKRLPTEPITGESAAVARDRARWMDCNAGRHVWAELPEHLGAPVCLHCPVRADQGERVRDARRTRAAR